MSGKKKKNNFGVQNFYEKKEVQCYNRKYVNPNVKYHQIKIPFRMTVIGASRSGKTNILLNLLNMMTNTFNHIYLFTRNLDEPLYDPYPKIIYIVMKDWKNSIVWTLIMHLRVNVW